MLAARPAMTTAVLLPPSLAALPAPSRGQTAHCGALAAGYRGGRRPDEAGRHTNAGIHGPLCFPAIIEFRFWALSTDVKVIVGSHRAAWCH